MRKWMKLISLGLLPFSSLAHSAEVFVTYYHNDLLGSPVAATDEWGNILWREHYRPYGERQETPEYRGYGSIGFTGHAQNQASGLVYAGARYYDHVVGRFLSVDPVGAGNDIPGSFNRYVYGLNNPYKYFDPKGMDVVVVINNNDPLIGTHAGVYVGNKRVSVLFDPGGSYRVPEKGSGDALYDNDANLEEYIAFQRLDGDSVQSYKFKTTLEEDGEIIDKIQRGGCPPLYCAKCTGDVLRGVGPFKDLGDPVTPAGLGKELGRIQHEGE
ncbi:RHS repeat-associated core domain protein [compost metagenome]